MPERIQISEQRLTPIEPEQVETSFVKSTKSKVFIAAAPLVLIGLAAVLSSCQDEEIGQNPQVSETPSSPTITINPLINCSEGTHLETPNADDTHWPDLLKIQLKNEEIPNELQQLMDEEGICVFTDLSGEKNGFLLWFDDSSIRNEIKSELDKLVDAGIINFTDYEGIDKKP